MARNTPLKIQTLILVLIGMLACAGPALADKSSRKDKDHDGKHQKQEHREQEQERSHEERGGHGRDDDHAKRGKHFSDHHRTVVLEYLTAQYRSGHCPPGLIKKHNGCMPPGQAKKWVLGQRLPREVIYYEVPSEVVVQLGPPPAGHRYVRVASDVLLITIGTGMVLDAIQDLNR